MKANVLRNAFGLLGIFIVTLFFSSTALAQKGDIKLTRKTDIITSKVEITTPEITVARQSQWNVRLYFISKEGSPFLAIKHSTTTLPSDVTEFSVIFSNGEKFTKTNATPEPVAVVGLGFPGIVTSFPLTYAELEKFAANDITILQTKFSDFLIAPVLDTKVKDKDIEDLRKSAVALVGELSKNRIAGL